MHSAKLFNQLETLFGLTKHSMFDAIGYRSSNPASFILVNIRSLLVAITKKLRIRES
jgi:hypothetical protein